MQESAVRLGELAPDLTLPDHNGDWVSLSSWWEEQPLILIFLRHFNCPHCRAQMVELHHGYHTIEEAGGRLLFVGMGNSHRAHAFRSEMGIPYTVLADPDKNGYSAYGLARVNLLRQFSLHEIGHFIADKRIGGGSGISLGQDMTQLGGTFIIDTGGVVRFIHTTTQISDRPALAALLDTLTVYGA